MIGSGLTLVFIGREQTPAGCSSLSQGDYQPGRRLLAVPGVCRKGEARCYDLNRYGKYGMVYAHNSRQKTKIHV